VKITDYIVYYHINKLDGQNHILIKKMEDHNCAIKNKGNTKE